MCARAIGDKWWDDAERKWKVQFPRGIDTYSSEEVAQKVSDHLKKQFMNSGKLGSE